MSSGFKIVAPGCFCTNHGVEDDQELSRAGDQREYFGLAGGDEFGVLGLEDRVVACGHQGGHVEGRADDFTPPPQVVRLPRIMPLSRLIGATPTRAALDCLLASPSSGKHAGRVRAVSLPMPGTLVSRSSFSFQAGEHLM